MIIGIDPDVDKNGVAVLSKDRKLELYSMSFFELFDYLEQMKSTIKEVVIEAGWLIKKSNFHQENNGAKVASRIGKNTGANHETGRKILEMCRYLEIPYREVRPLKKIWKGTEGKITHEEFIKFTRTSFKRTNQEQRDAGLLIFGRFF